jgi:hypothetical protein
LVAILWAWKQESPSSSNSFIKLVVSITDFIKCVRRSLESAEGQRTGGST